MRGLFCLIFYMFTNPLGLPIEAWKEWLILLVIREIAYFVAFRIVGDMYGAGFISRIIGGSFFHWLVRLIVFVSMWIVTYGVIRAWQFCSAHWLAVASVLGGLLICDLVGVNAYRSMKGGTQNA